MNSNYPSDHRPFELNIIGKWDEEKSRLEIQYDHVPLFKKGVIANGYIDGHRIKSDDLFVINNGKTAFFIPSVKKFRGEYYAKTIFLKKPVKPKIDNEEHLYQFMGKQLNLKEVLKIKKIMHLLSANMGLKIMNRKWAFSPPVHKGNKIYKNAKFNYIKDFSHFLWMCKKAMSSYNKEEYILLRNIYKYWKDDPVFIFGNPAIALDYVAGQIMLSN